MMVRQHPALHVRPPPHWALRVQTFAGAQPLGQSLPEQRIGGQPASEAQVLLRRRDATREILGPG